MASCRARVEHNIQLCVPGPLGPLLSLCLLVAAGRLFHSKLPIQFRTPLSKSPISGGGRWHARNAAE